MCCSQTTKLGGNLCEHKPQVTTSAFCTGHEGSSISSKRGLRGEYLVEYFLPAELHVSVCRRKRVSCERPPCVLICRSSRESYLFLLNSSGNPKVELYNMKKTPMCRRRHLPLQRNVLWRSFRCHKPLCGCAHLVSNGCFCLLVASESCAAH